MSPNDETWVEHLRNRLSLAVNAAVGKPQDYPWTPQLVLDFEAAVRAEATTDTPAVGGADYNACGKPIEMTTLPYDGKHNIGVFLYCDLPAGHEQEFHHAELVWHEDGSFWKVAQR